MTQKTFTLEINPTLPPTLARLEELAGNLRFSWHRPTRKLFESLDPELWNAVAGNPRLFLRHTLHRLLLRAEIALAPSVPPERFVVASVGWPVPMPDVATISCEGPRIPLIPLLIALAMFSHGVQTTAPVPEPPPPVKVAVVPAVR